MALREAKIKGHSVYGLEALTFGLYLEGSRYAAPEGSARVAQNLIFNDDGTLGSRPGRAKFHSVGQEVKYFKRITYLGNPASIVQTDTALYFVQADATTHLRALSGSDVVSVIEAGDTFLVSINDTLHEYFGGILYPSKLFAPGSLTLTTQAGGTIPAGTYQYRVAFLFNNGTTGPATPPQSITVGANSSITITVPDNTDPRIHSVKFYRKGANDPAFLLIHTKTGTGKFWHQETSLAVPAPEIAQDDLSEMPGGIMLIQGGRLYVYSKGRLYYSHPFEFRARSAFYDELVTLPEGDKVTALVPVGSGVGIFGLRNATLLTGAPVEGGGLQPLTISDGCLNQNSWTVVPQGTLFLGTFGLWLMQGAQPVQLSKGVTPLILKIQPETAAVAYWPDQNLVLVSDRKQVVTANIGAERVRFATWDLRPSMIEEYANTIYYAEGGFVYSLTGDMDYVSPTASKAITHLFESNPLSVGDNTATKLFRRAELIFSGSGVTQVTFGIRPVMGEDVGLVSETSFANSSGSVWGKARWGTAKWGGGQIATRNRVVAPSNIIGQYIIFIINSSTTRYRSYNVLAPVNFELRAKDRFGRN